ncbi:MAG: PTS transporter subunit EIIB [Bacilli bacterium]|nr:PTS transporter subunit EIIB [Bacilli bacterium]
MIDFHTIIQYVIIGIILLLISLVILKLSKKDFGIEINKLVKYLGGKDNILDTEVNMSRFKVTLKDVSIVDKEGIQKLGAKGIVEIDNQLKIIFGNDSRTLKRYVDELKK